MTNPFYYFEFKCGQFDNHCLSLSITVTHSLLADFANLICDFSDVFLLIFIFSPHCILIHPYRKLHRKFETIEHLFDLRK